MGKGEAYFPWMHIDDVVFRHLFLLENGEATRVFNGGTSDYTTQKEIVTLFAKKADISLVLPFPRLLMELYFGDFTRTFMSSVKMDVKKATHLGFTFKYQNLNDVLESLE